MISKIEIKNFKSLKKIFVNTKKLNLLMGLNGMGKSSFIQTILLLMQSDKLEDNIVDLNGVLTQIGQAKDALYQYAEKDYIYLGLDFIPENTPNEILDNYLSEQNNRRKTPERDAILKEIYSLDGSFDVEELFDRMKKNDNNISRATFYNSIKLFKEFNLIIEHKHKNNKGQYEKAHYNSFAWEFEYQPDKDKLIAKQELQKTAIECFRTHTKKFQYISAERIGPKDLYEASSIIVADKKQIGLLGEFAAHYINMYASDLEVAESLRYPNLFKSTTLKEQLNAWLNEISPGISLNTKYVPEINKVILDYQFDLGNSKTNSFRPKNVGFGISYVLPIVLALLTSTKDKIIVIENPESHIHPRGQAELGKLIALAAQNGAQLFVETHSDHILNGIRVAVKENSIDRTNVHIMYFDKVTTDKEQYSKITDIKIDKNGTLSDYPEHLLDEWSNQLSQLI